jgi:hypothetical protein
MHTVIWYSWLGGIIIGTMIGANMVLEEHAKSGPRNVIITGRYICTLPSANSLKKNEVHMICNILLSFSLFFCCKYDMQYFTNF